MVTMLRNRTFQKNNGFTLVEVLVALSIITIIVISFTTLLASSYVNIISAGKKSLASYSVQEEMEERIAHEQATDVGDLQIPFPKAGNINVAGGFIELQNTQGVHTSQSTAFLPVLVVIIEPDPEYHLVGLAQTITVNIKTRNVIDGKVVKAAIYKLTDPETILDDTTGVINGNTATLFLEVSADYNPGTSENDFNHIISVEIHDIDRVFKVPYRVFRPAFLAGAASGKIYAASNPADLWDEINTPVTYDILDIYSLANTFFAVGRGGTILFSENGSTWDSLASGTTNDLYAMSANGSNLIIVGQKGTLLSSNNNGVTWIDNSSSIIDFYEEVDDTPVFKSITNNLHAVANIGTNFVAVGNGVILFSQDNGVSWEEVVVNGNIIFNDVIYTGSKFIAVGNGGIIYISLDGVNWSSLNITHANLNGIAYTTGKIVVVGTGGSILYSADHGSTWSSATNSTTSNLTDITYGYNSFVAVGANGIILKSINGELWQIVSTPDITANLFSVTDR